MGQLVDIYRQDILVVLLKKLSGKLSMRFTVLFSSMSRFLLGQLVGISARYFGSLTKYLSGTTTMDLTFVRYLFFGSAVFVVYHHDQSFRNTTRNGREIINIITFITMIIIW